MVSMNPLNNYRGQVAVFYALLVPVFLFLGGVGLDLGWYYLNVSRLQNAADAAVLVGANKLIEEHDTFKNKNYKARLVDKFPADKPETTISTTAGDDVAKDYAKKNLEDNSTSYAPPNLFSVAQAADNDPIKDGYTRGDNTVDMTTGLYRDGGDYFYVVGLNEDIHHFFIGFFPDMNAGVVSVALMSKNIDDSDDPPDGDLDPKKIILNANGGTLTDENYNQEQTQRNIGVTVNEEDKTKYNDTKLPSEKNIELKRSEYTFIGWNTKADGTGTFYGDGNTFTSDDLKSLN